MTRKRIAASLGRLRRMEPGEIIKKYSSITQEIFKSATRATPVIIPSRNEERDIPSCLVALANSDVPVKPIVVVNCTVDRTAEFAEKMGATVVNIDGVKKMGATQKGLRTAIRLNLWAQNTPRVVLFTDADTLAPRQWARTLTRHLLRAARKRPERGSAVFGTSLYLHGPSMLSDIGQCVHAFFVDVRQWLLQGPPLIRGHNYGILLDDKDRMLNTLFGLDPLQMYRDDVTIHDNLKNSGTVIARCLHPQAIVRTRGDRAHSLRELLKNLFQPGYEKSTYDIQYDISGDCKPDKKAELAKPLDTTVSRKPSEAQLTFRGKTEIM